MALIPCFSHTTDPELIKKLGGLKDLSEDEQRTAGKKMVMDYHKQLHGELNDLRDKSGLAKLAYKAPKDNTDKINYIKSQPEGPVGGISHNIREAKAGERGSPPEERGEVRSRQQLVDRGKELLKNGANPDEVIAQFHADNKKISSDTVGVVRAKLEELQLATFRAKKAFGEDSPQFKEAKAAEDSFAVASKPMQTAWSEIGLTQQGQTDLTTGDVSDSERMEQIITTARPGERFTNNEREKAEKLSGDVKKTSSDVEKAERKVKKALGGDKEEAETPKKTFAEMAKSAADKFRKLKTEPFQFRDSDGNVIDVHTMGVTWNDLVELGAKAIEKTGKIADGLSAVLDHLKDNDWYNKLSAPDKKAFQDQLSDHYGDIAEADQKASDEAAIGRIGKLQQELKDLQDRKEKVKTPKDRSDMTAQEQVLKDRITAEKKAWTAEKQNEAISQKKLALEFAKKRSTTFTPAEAKKIWGYAKKNYINTGNALNFDDMVQKMSGELGLTPNQIREAIASPKSKLREITDEMYTARRKQAQAVQKAKDWVEQQKMPWVKRTAEAIPRAFFEEKIFGHGTVGMITHAGTDSFNPRYWSIYYPHFIKQFGAAFGGDAAYEKMLTDLQKDPMFTPALRMGLVVDPKQISSEGEYVGIKSIFNRFKIAGERGFNVLKVYRLAKFKSEWNSLPDALKTEDMGQRIADMVNHSTGTISGKIHPAVNTFIFAPKLEASRWARIINEPLQAGKTLAKMIGGSATPEEIQALKIFSKNAGAMMATYLGMLAANQGLLKATGSKDSVNFIHPHDDDWLKFKAGGRTLDIAGGMIGTMRFASQLIHESYRIYAHGIKKEKDNPEGADISLTGRRVVQKLSPLATTFHDIFISGTDANGNALPFSKVKPAPWGHKMQPNAKGFLEYLLTDQAPIPVAEMAKTMFDGMREKKAPPSTIENFANGTLSFLVAGGTGVQMHEEHKKKK